MKRTKMSLAVCVAALIVAGVSAAVMSAGKTYKFPFQNPNLPIDERVKDVVSRMTLEEKILQMNANAPAIQRLGINEYNYGSEALHGVAKKGFTVFPMAIAFGATWDPGLITEVTTAISDEARGAVNRDRKKDGYPGKMFLTFWSPTVNMARDPRWGRTPETYGEDPYLTSRIGVAFVKGLQGNDPKYLKCISTPKHFAANNEEHNRFECNVKLSDRTMYDYYFPGFKALIQEGHAQSVMGAYNAINGIPCCANKWLLTDVLRDEWGFDGYIVTDCGAPELMMSRHKYAKTGEEAATYSIQAGVDVECGGEKIFPKYIASAIKEGKLNEAQIDTAVSRLMKARMQLGMFDPPEMVPFTKISPKVISSKEHAALARRVTRESIVLLKNENSLLPLNASKIKSIAVVGPNSDIVVFGDYSGTPAKPAINLVQGIKNRVGAKVKVSNAKWLSLPAPADYLIVTSKNLKTPDGKPGVKAEYFANKQFAGDPAAARTEKEINLISSAVPEQAFGKPEGLSIRWTGKLTPSNSGAHYLSVTAYGKFSLYLNGKLILESVEKKEKKEKKKSGLSTGKALDLYAREQEYPKKQFKIIMLEAGKSYDVKIEYVPKGSATAKLDWVPPTGEAVKIRADEMKMIKNADVVIAAMGYWRDHEHESRDRADIYLPEGQDEYMQAITSLNKKTAVVLINGSAIAINWMKENIPAIVEAWYAGQEAGNGIADVLFGDYNPAGRLPFTFYKSNDDLPPFDDYEVSKGRTYMYFDKEPLYPFGYGLSYTKFAYDGLSISSKNLTKSDTLTVSFNVKNTGGRDGDEVAQLYVRDIESSVKQPRMQLKAFKRVRIKKGETKKVTLTVPIKNLSFWDEKTRDYIVEPGEFEIMVGASSADIRLKDKIVVK